jgi:hypothetical protein
MRLIGYKLWLSHITHERTLDRYLAKEWLPIVLMIAPVKNPARQTANCRL